jgi:pimeloyl-ACP methyl ester carboxylesterase
MNQKSLIRSLASLVALGTVLTAPSLLSVSAQDTPATGSYATVNGLKLYYEIHGEGGEPLVLLHGGLGGIVEYAGILPTLAQNRQVIAVEMQGHGHTADIDRPLTYENMADDVAALIQQLGLKQADVMGFSLGGGVALQTAIRHPEVVRRLVLVSTPFRRDGWYPEVLAGMATMSADAAKAMIETPMYQFYASAAPKPEDWPRLVSKVGDLLRQDYDWSKDVAKLKLPVLVVVGDADSVRPQHALELFSLLGGGQKDGAMGGLPNAQFAVLPGTTHFTMLSRADLLPPIVTGFLDKPAAQ